MADLAAVAALGAAEEVAGGKQPLPPHRPCLSWYLTFDCQWDGQACSSLFFLADLVEGRRGSGGGAVVAEVVTEAWKEGVLCWTIAHRLCGSLDQSQSALVAYCSRCQQESAFHFQRLV